MKRCPTCNSPEPHLHPSVQFDGEVEPCTDPYHLQITPQNTKQRIEEHKKLLERIGKAVKQ